MSAPSSRSPGPVVVALLVAIVATGAWLALRGGRPADDPARVFDECRDGILAGDNGVLWRLMSPTARAEYAAWVDTLREPKQPGQKTTAEQLRKAAGISEASLRAMPPDQVLALESKAFAESQYRGARVHRVDRGVEGIGPDEAILHISLRGGGDRTWRVRRVDGAWRVEKLWLVLNPDGKGLRDGRPG